MNFVFYPNDPRRYREIWWLNSRVRRWNWLLLAAFYGATLIEVLVARSQRRITSKDSLIPVEDASSRSAWHLIALVIPVAAGITLGMLLSWGRHVVAFFSVLLLILIAIYLRRNRVVRRCVWVTLAIYWGFAFSVQIVAIPVNTSWNRVKPMGIRPSSAPSNGPTPNVRSQLSPAQGR